MQINSGTRGRAAGADKQQEHPRGKLLFTDKNYALRVYDADGRKDHRGRESQNLNVTQAEK